jgi:HEAT repeat protein
MPMQRPTLETLYDPGLGTLGEAVTRAKDLLRTDPHLPERLLSLIQVSGRLSPGHIDRIMNIAGAITPPERLRVLLAGFLVSTDKKVRSKAYKLFAACNQDLKWATQQVAESEPRVAANIVEALWKAAPSEPLTWFFWRAAAHDDNRVAGNGIIGLFLLRHQRATEALQRMFRKQDAGAVATAAWVAGRVADPVWQAFLKPLEKHPDGTVRRNVATALRRIRAKHPEAA